MLIYSTRRALAMLLFVSASLLLTTCMQEVVEEKEDAKEFLTFTVNGVSRTWTPSRYHLYSKEDTNLQVNGWYNIIGAYDTAVFGAIDMTLIRPDNSSAEPPLAFDIESIYINDPPTAPDWLGAYFPIFVSQATITEFGGIGQYTAGHFQGRYIKSTISTDDTVTVSCSWRIKREPI